MPETWQRLRSTHERSTIPPLLFKYHPTCKGYEVFLTDLIYIWSEKLGHKDVLKRACDEETSIDPSEDADQFNVLLQKIGEALHGSDKDSVTIRSRLNTNKLELVIKTGLPAPLQPLEWTLHLSKEPQAELTRYLLLPLLRDAAEREKHEKSLLDHLKEKDRILCKLLDKINSSGLDLSTFFPGTAGLRTTKRGTTLSQAAKYITGVAPFDETAWRQGMRSGASEDLGINLAEEFLFATSLLDIQGCGVAPDKWWEGLDNEAPVSRPSCDKETTIEMPASSSIFRGSNRNMEASNGEQCENRKTPTKWKQPGHREQDHQQNDYTVHAGNRASTRVSPSPMHGKQIQKQLGTIGARRPPVPRSGSSTASDLSTSPIAPRNYRIEAETEMDGDLRRPSSRGGISHTGDETMSEGELLSQRRARTAEQPRALKKTIPRLPNSGLGLIVRNKKAKAQKQRSPSPQSPPPPPLDENQDLSTDDGEPLPKKTAPLQRDKPVKRTGKLGVIGGPKAKFPAGPLPNSSTTADSTASETDEAKPTTITRVTARPAGKNRPEASRPAMKSEPEPEPEPELTVEDKANRRREELKRQLTAKAQAPSAKKKRRF